MSHQVRLTGLPASFATLILALTLGSIPALHARDAFVVLSGGVSPQQNNYSQYLQAKALSTYFERNYPRDSVWVFFGVGNVQGEAPILGDVRHQMKRDGLLLESWQAGPLSRNRPARREVFLRALREEILPTVAKGGTLYLFVGDHGSQTSGTNSESVIDLWTLAQDSQNERGWRSTPNERLGVSELRQVLAAGLGKGRVVFCMTQCHSGGFHYLAVPREMTPNPKWFTIVPDWAKGKEQPAFPLAAGFTATDEASLAAGCDPDPDPEKWAGYERFIPENLLGLDLFTLERTGKALPSFAKAHEVATLVDRTIDKPFSTSEHYLERWATLIETRLAKETNLTEKVRKQLVIYQNSVDGAASKVLDIAFRERQATFKSFVTRMTEQNADVKKLLLTGTRKELEEAIGPARRPGPTPSPTAPGGRGQGAAPQPQTPAQPAPGQRAGRGRGGAGAAGGEVGRLWTETIRPAWKAAVEGNKVTDVPAAALEFEKYLLGQEAKGRNYFFGDAGSMRNEIYWQSGYSNPLTLDPAKAEAVARWGVERRGKISTWAKTAEEEAVRAAADRLAPASARPPQRGTGSAAAPTPPVLSTPSTASNVSTRNLSKRVAAERTLFYRRTLAAWEFLLGVGERPALARLRELTQLERTPLPMPISPLKNSEHHR